MVISKKSAVLPEVTGYETSLRFYATRYTQGGRTVYALDLSLDQVKALVAKPNPNAPTPGNRAIRPNHAASFGKYIRENEGWIAPAMILRAPSSFHFDVRDAVEGAEFGILSIPRQSASDIRILDGQHRTLGIYLADEGISFDLDKARSVLASARRQDPDGAGVAEAQKRIDVLNEQRIRLVKERLSLQIYVEDDPAQFKQMFFDIADNALGITASVKSRFDSRKVVNRSLEAVLEHPLLRERVNMEDDRLGRGSPFLFSAKHIAEIVRSTTVGLDGRVGRRAEAELNERDVAAAATKYFDTIVEAFPPYQAVLLGQLLPEMLRKTSLLGSVLVTRILAGVFWELQKEHAFSQPMVEEFFELLAPHMQGPAHANSVWVQHAPDGLFADGAMGPSGRRQDLTALKNTIVGWALDKPAFLAEEPKAAPEPDVDPELGIGYTAFGADVPAVK